MAHNDLKPNYSSMEGEETSGSDSDDVSDTDSGEKQKQETKKTIIAPSKSANKPQAPDPSSSEAAESGSESDSDSGSDSDSPPKFSAVVDPNVIPMERSVEINKDGSKPISTPSPAKSKRPAAAPATIEKDSKKAKQNSVNTEPVKALISPSKSANKRQVPDLSSSEAEEIGSDTDSDLPPKMSNVIDPNVKPISSVPMESKSLRIYGSKTTPTASPSKSKPPAATPTTAKKNTMFQRLWSEDDEIVILKGMIDYKAEKNWESHIVDISEFHEFIRKSLHVDVSNAQLADKVKRLKKKYVNNANREKDGKDPFLLKAHEQKVYELSKLIWRGNCFNSGTKSNKNQYSNHGYSKGNAAGTGTAASLPTSNGVDDRQNSKMEAEKKIDISRFVLYSGLNDSLILPEEIVKAGMGLVDDSRRAELEEKWKELKEEELVVYVKRMELLREQALVVLEAIRSSGN